MSTLFALLTFGCCVAIPVLLIIFIIKAIRKKPKRKLGFAMLGCFIGAIVFGILFGVTDPTTNCEHEYAVIEEIAAECGKEGYTKSECTKCKHVITEPIPALEHEWEDATCEKPKTCKLCGITEGEKSGHKWVEATCQTPKTCEICKATEGSTAGHEWTDATCTEPKTCSICGETEGTPLSENGEHSWTDATCKEPKTCSVCGETEGKPLDHTLGEWEVTEEATVETQGTRVQKCTVCGDVINTEKFDSPYKVIAEKLDEVVTGHGGKTTNVGVFPQEGSDTATVTAGLYCENSEEKVYEILNDIQEELSKLEIKSECVFVVADITKGDDAPALATAVILADGSVSVTSLSTEFKTKHNEWISGQFSAWDGSHKVLKDLIVKNLNDEKSFKHIETTYRDIATETDMNEVNKVLKNAGYSNRVEVGDLFIVTQFSAKNAFNATIKNTAYGIASYKNDTVTLIAIE